jgi:hypothetical protein
MTNEQIHQLRTEVRSVLQHLAPSVYPYFSSLACTADGLHQAEAIVLGYMAKNGVLALTAIAQLESEYEAG